MLLSLLSSCREPADSEGREGFGGTSSRVNRRVAISSYAVMLNVTVGEAEQNFSLST